MDLVLSSAELWQLCEQLADEAEAAMERGAERGGEGEVDMGAAGEEAVQPPSSSSSSSSATVTVVDYLTRQTPPPRSHPNDNHDNEDLSDALRLEAICRNASPDGRALCLAADAPTGSGATLEYLFRLAAARLYGVDLWGRPLVYTAGRNPDMSEVDLGRQGLDPAGLPEGTRLVFAKAYGFRNIQSIVLKMKQGKCEVRRGSRVEG